MNCSNDGLTALLARRANELSGLFETIARTRMAGLPMLNAALRVQAIGFKALPVDAGHTPAAALGILLTPWFMNLVRLPLERNDSADGIGGVHTLRLQGRTLEFIGAHEPAVGAFAACSLFSPVFEFANHADAVATAQAVLAELRTAPCPPRRAFLFGRAGAAV